MLAIQIFQCFKGSAHLAKGGRVAALVGMMHQYLLAKGALDDAKFRRQIRVATRGGGCRKQIVRRDAQRGEAFLNGLHGWCCCLLLFVVVAIAIACC